MPNLHVSSLPTAWMLMVLGYSIASAQDASPKAQEPSSIRLTQSVGQLTLRDWAGESATSSVDPVTYLHLDLQSYGMHTIVVAPGDTVEYQISGLLDNDAHQGLALVGFDLVFDGGDLEAANHPTGVPTPGCDNPMINFERPWGITNPDTPCPPACGYGGTIIDGDLIQIGGGQNTINNTESNAPFPIGPVLLGVATPGGCGPAEIVTGALTAPDTEGTYTLTVPLSSVFANVIAAGDPCDPDPEDPATFCPAVAAGAGSTTSLTIIVNADFVPVPTMSQWGIVSLSLLLLAAGTLSIRRRHTLINWRMPQ